MAGLSRAYDSTEIELGPGDLWLGPALPTTGNRPTIAAASDGALTPDATESAGAIHVGLTMEGCVVKYAPNITEFEADEQTAPVISSIIGEPSSISGSMLQILDFATMVKMIAGGNRSTGSGYDQITWGGKQAITTFTALLIAPIYNDPTKIVAVELYKCYNKAGFELAISRKKMAATAFELTGMAISSRPQNDQIGIMFKTT